MGVGLVAIPSSVDVGVTVTEIVGVGALVIPFGCGFPFPPFVGDKPGTIVGTGFVPVGNVIVGTNGVLVGTTVQFG